MKKIFNNKILSTMVSVVEWTICIVLVILIILTGVQRFSQQGDFFGYRIYVVASGSMIPEYNIGDTVLVKDVPKKDLHVGDNVTYLGNEGSVKGLIVTHKITKVELDPDGKLVFVTKGLANNVADPLVKEEQIFGKVTYKFILLSLLGKVTTSMPLLFTFITIPIAILIAIELIKIVYKKDENEAK